MSVLEVSLCLCVAWGGVCVCHVFGDSGVCVWVWVC